MDQDDLDDLESTMRHGLEELANDAPRGEGLWETTTSMIAIEFESEAESPVAAPLLPSSPDRRGLLPTTPPPDASTVRRGDDEC